MAHSTNASMILFTQEILPAPWADLFDEDGFFATVTTAKARVASIREAQACGLDYEDDDGVDLIVEGAQVTPLSAAAAVAHYLGGEPGDITVVSTERSIAL